MRTVQCRFGYLGAFLFRTHLLVFPFAPFYFRGMFQDLQIRALRMLSE